MKIVMLAPFGIRPKGTLSARMLPLAQALVRRGDQVTIVAPAVHNPEDAGTRRDYDSVPVIHIRQSRLRGAAAAVEQVALLLNSGLAEYPDLVHLFKPKGYSGLAALFTQQIHPYLPLVVDTDDWEGWGGWNDLLPYPLPAKYLFAWQERDLPRRAAAVTVVSRALEQQVLGFGVPRERVFYVPNGSGGLPVIVAQPRDSVQPTILLYTRFWEFTIADVVAALVGIKVAFPNARLLVIGKGERGEERELLERAARAGVAAMIDYRGWVEPTALPALIASADLALVPMDDTLLNRARGLAKLLELMNAGLPIVAARVGQIAEYLVHSESGWLVAPNDGGALAAGVIRVLQDTPLRHRLASGTRMRAADFAWDVLAETVTAAYDLAFHSW